jgi:hypothetical protein
MAVLTALSNVPVRNPMYSSSFAAAADVYYQGGLAYHISGGISPVPAAGSTLAGVIAETKTALTGDEIPLIVAGQIGVPNTVAGANALAGKGMIGKLVFCDVSAASDNVGDLIISGALTATTDFSIGRLTAYDLNGYSWVDITRGAEATRIP